MMKWLVVLTFVAGAALSWGVYVPVVHRAAFGFSAPFQVCLCCPGLLNLVGACCKSLTELRAPNIRASEQHGAAPLCICK